MSTPDLINAPSELNPRIDWRELAVCSGQTTLFFARKAERPEARARRELKARRLCNGCPVQLQCRDYARENHLYGFWGGESETSDTAPATRSRRRSASRGASTPKRNPPRAETRSS
jgi:WhiB family transcriptional regulator, redox-sensing transcriptional regulator